ncbi:hypothetical protein SOVF_045910 [Spinacia oleracea]|nr:hypothetical protein SOVF_045910 [Spinacia oleracea]
MLYHCTNKTAPTKHQKQHWPSQQPSSDISNRTTLPMQLLQTGQTAVTTEQNRSLQTHCRPPETHQVLLPAPRLTTRLPSNRPSSSLKHHRKPPSNQYQLCRPPKLLANRNSPYLWNYKIFPDTITSKIIIQNINIQDTQRTIAIPRLNNVVYFIKPNP